MLKIVPGITLLITLLFLFGCRMPFPEAETPAAKLYMEKCDTCHPPFHPKTLTAREWAGIVEVMEKRVTATGVRPNLTEDEKATILDYLRRNSRTRVF